MSTERPQRETLGDKPREKFVVVVQRTELQKDIYGPYSKFRTAEGDAKAWGGSVEPLKSPSTAP